VTNEPCTPTRPGAGREDGFTIVEVMVAMVIMLVGVLGTLTAIQSSAESSSKTNAREQGTNLARDLVERTRQASYSSVTMAAAPATLRATLPSSEVGTLSGSTFTVKRRGVTYNVTVFACSIDDPSDGAGVGNATFCDAPGATTVPGSPPPGAAASVNVLGIGVSAAGSLLQTVCNALGISSIASTLSAALSAVAPISVCPSGGTGTAAYDVQPDDLRRVRIDVSWTRSGTTSSISQTTLLTNPLQPS
jgi:type IV pilus modification protein PilV